MSRLDKPASSEDRRRPYLLPVAFAGFIGVVISLLLYLMAVGWGEERLQRAFVTAADDRISSLNTRMGFKLQQLNSLAVFFESSQYVSPEEFSHFVSHLSEDNEAGFAYAWIPHVRDDERESFEGSLNSSGKTALEIRDKKNKTMVRAASRSDYFPIQYLQPEQKSWMTIGYDLATNVDMQEALNTARISLSPRASLAGAMQDRSGETGIVMFVPVFHGMVTQANQHQKLQGFVAGVFSPDAVLAKSISDFEPAGLDLDLFDISTESAPKHLATYTAITRNAQNSSMRDHQTLLSQVLSYSRKIEVAGKTWEVIASPAPAFFEGQKNLLPIFILGFGLLLTGSLCLLLYSTVQNAHRQRQFANAAIAAKEALECSEKMLSDAQAMAKLGNWNWDIQSNELQWSDEIYRIFGLQPQQFGASYEAFLNSVHPDDREMVNHATSAAVEHGTHYAIDHRIVLADGSERFVHEEGGAIFEDGKAVRMMGTVQDITEQRGLEDQLRHAQKMEAIGTLVGGIAHDFNNTLAAIQGNVYLARRAAQGNAVVLDKLTAVEKMGGRAADMIKKLLTFARKDTVSIATFSMNELVEETVMLARRGFAEDVEIRCEVSDQNLPVAGDISLLEQVILNLLNNAYDAVSQVESPLISCSLQPSRADEFLRIRHPELEGDVFALLVIRDNGYGIPEKYLKNIFEPFFTTKEVGKGTGLGLSMAYGAIHNHGGVIEVSSKQGEGCEFKIYLPICSEAGVPQGDELIDDVAKGEGETILLVDDHHDMRSSSAEVLSELGYQVIEAVDGEQAVELFNANRERLDIIISDVVMPKMSGIDAVRHIRALGGDLPVVFVSGYSEEKTGLVDGSVANSRLLAKPYDVGELSQLLRRLIEAEKT